MGSRVGSRSRVPARNVDSRITVLSRRARSRTKVARCGGPTKQGSHVNAPAATRSLSMSRPTRPRGVVLCALAAAVLCVPTAATAGARPGVRAKIVVAFTAPTGGATVSGLLSGAACEASATGRFGIDRVEFSADGLAIDVDQSAPYNCLWDTTGGSPGQHTLTARAVD